MVQYATTPTGRIVWSSGNAPQDRAPVIDTRTKLQRVNPKDNTPVFEYGFGLAIPKAEFGPIWTVMQSEAMKFINPPPPFGAGNFAYKVIDGDSMDKGNIQRGIPPKPYSDREGYAGCFVIAIKSQLPTPPVVFVWGGSGWVQADPNNIDGAGNKLKTGDYVQVGLGIDAHLGESPGLYLNPQAIQFVGFGKAIIRGPDAATLFGTGPAALPPGATATPQAPAVAPAGLPGAVPAPAAPAGLPGMPTAAPLAPAAPGGLPGMPQAATAPSAVPPVASPAAGLPAPVLPTASPSSPVPPATGFTAAAAGLPGMPAAAPAPAPAPAAPAAPAVPVGLPAGSVQVGFDPNNGKAIWQAPDGNRYYAP